MATKSNKAALANLEAQKDARVAQHNEIVEVFKTMVAASVGKAEAVKALVNGVNAERENNMGWRANMMIKCASLSAAGNWSEEAIKNAREAVIPKDERVGTRATMASEMLSVMHPLVCKGFKTALVLFRDGLAAENDEDGPLHGFADKVYPGALRIARLVAKGATMPTDDAMMRAFAHNNQRDTVENSAKTAAKRLRAITKQVSDFRDLYPLAVFNTMLETLKKIDADKLATVMKAREEEVEDTEEDEEEDEDNVLAIPAPKPAPKPTRKTKTEAIDNAIDALTA